MKITKEQARTLKFIFDTHYSNAKSIVKAELGFSDKEFEILKTAYHKTDGWKSVLHVPKRRFGHQKNRLKKVSVLVDMGAKSIAVPTDFAPTEKDQKDIKTLSDNGFTIQTSIV